jgi:hypothetical protein
MNRELPMRRATSATGLQKRRNYPGMVPGFSIWKIKKKKHVNLGVN